MSPLSRLSRLSRLAAAAILASSSIGCGASPPPAPAPLPSDPGFVVVGAAIFDGERFRSGNVQVIGATIAGFVDAPPDGAKVIDGRGKTLLPGLIDGHAHIGESTEHLQRFLGFGVTTVIDLFGPVELLAKLRADDLSPEGLRRASLFGAGTLATAPGGHGTEYGVPIPTIARPEDADAFVAARKVEGSDFLKIVYDNGTKDAAGTDVSMPTLTLETVRALVTAAHARALVVAVHTGGCDDLRAILGTGADVLAHGCAMPEGDDLPSRLAAAKVFFNPTLAVQLRPCGLEYWIPLVADAELSARLTEEERARLGKDRKDHDTACSSSRLRLVGEAARLGVPLIAGPDSPNRRIPVGASLIAEIELLRQAGATLEQSLAAATANPATAYHLGDRGRIAKGLRADLLLVEGDLRTTPHGLWHLRALWKAGQTVKL